VVGLEHTPGTCAITCDVVCNETSGRQWVLLLKQSRCHVQVYRGLPQCVVMRSVGSSARSDSCARRRNRECGNFEGRKRGERVRPHRIRDPMLCARSRGSEPAKARWKTLRKRLGRCSNSRPVLTTLKSARPRFCHRLCRQNGDGTSPSTQPGEGYSIKSRCFQYGLGKHLGSSNCG
jgi:hypothetical protein